MQNHHALDRTWWMLRITFGVIPIAAGLDKFTNLLVNWERYLNPVAERILPISGSAFMMVVGVIEILAGLLVLSRWTRLGAYVVSAWLVAIAINLLAMGTFLDIAVRDLALAVGAFTLAKLTEARQAGTRAPAGELHPVRRAMAA